MGGCQIVLTLLPGMSIDSTSNHELIKAVAAKCVEIEGISGAQTVLHSATLGRVRTTRWRSNGRVTHTTHEIVSL